MKNGIASKTGPALAPPGRSVTREESIALAEKAPLDELLEAASELRAPRLLHLLHVSQRPRAARRAFYDPRRSAGAGGAG